MIVQPDQYAAQAIRSTAKAGGDLTRLIDIPSVSQFYEELRPEADFWTDRYGYQNYPAANDVSYPVVVVGDSFMRNGVTMEQSFPGQLAFVSGLAVYNHALAGWGSFVSVARFLRSERFRANPPRVLVWGLLEREVEGEYLEGLVYQVYTIRHKDPQRTRRAVFNLAMLRPAQLGSSLLASSAASQWAGRLWNRIRYFACGEVNPYVIPVREQIDGRRVLFYYPAIDAMGWDASRRNVEKVAEAVRYLDEACRERGIRLAVVLIPDKEQVYREYIPARFLPLPPSCMEDLRVALERRDIVAIDLLPSFREEASAGKLLYWADDTHWNPQGIRLAAEIVWSRIQEVLSAQVKSDL